MTMTNHDIRLLIDDVIKTSEQSVVTDWLSYCLLRSVDVKVLEEREIMLQCSLRSGVPAVGTRKLIDNDFYAIQSDEWKEKYNLLCRSEFAVCIEIIEDSNVDDNNKEFINIKIHQFFLAFSDPDNSISLNFSISTS